MKNILFSGIQPSGKLTIGNYIGVLKKWNKLQYNYNCIFCIADLHSINNNINPLNYKNNILDTLSLIIASGINPYKNIIFTQSSIEEHTQLSWILSHYIYYSELKNMFQFKNKFKNINKKININILSYPILMISDILLYNTNIVVVGKDQKQHLELLKFVVKRFNNIYKDTFIIPNYKIENDSFIMSLMNPNKKMSKSDLNENNVITLLEDEISIIKKINKAVTDSDNPSFIYFDEINKPGISNLLKILSSISDNSIEYVIKSLHNKSYKDLKKITIDKLIIELNNLKSKYYNIRNNEKYLLYILKEGKKKAKKIATNNLNKIKEKIGFINI